MLFGAWQMNQQLKRVEAVYNTIYAFMATATEEEYDEITEELRHSLVLRTLTAGDLAYLDLIPNTADDCPLDRELNASLYLAALNTGTLYPIAPEETADAAFRFGYDEVSQSRVLIESGAGTTAVTLTRDGGEVSVQRMKGIFCGDCFSALAEVQTGSPVLEFVLFDAQTHTIYPIAESAEYTFERCTATILRDGEDYIISVVSASP